MSENKPMTGYPSIDKPWLKYYSEDAINAPLPKCTMYQYIWENNKDHLSDIALRYYGTKISYGRLFENIKKAASAFYSMGVRAGNIVTIMSMHTPETIYAIYGLNYIGAVANMVYMTLAEKEILHTIENTESKLFLVLDAALDKVEAIKSKLNVPVVVLGVADSMPPHVKLGYRLKVKPKKHTFMTWQGFLKQNVDEPPLATDHAAPAVIVYTSGTTGEPKGVVLSSDALNAHSFQEKYANFGFERGKSFLLILPPFIGFGISHIHLAFNTGVDCTLWIELTPDAITNAFFKVKPVFFVTGPVFIDAFIKHKVENLKQLKLYVGGGGALPEKTERELNAFLKECGTNTTYSNGYGMTETGSTLCCSTNDFKRIGSVGLPMPLTNVKITDVETGDELEYGKIGELCFSTPNMMSYYYKNEKATKEMLFTDIQGKLWIHSGDLGMVDKDGYVFITGRQKRLYPARSADGIVCRLFPQRIEEFMVSCDGVEKCAVIVEADEERLNVPIVFVTLSKSTLQNDTLLSGLWCEAYKTLSSHELPKCIIILDEMPMTVSGKTDYRALEKTAKGN